MRILTGTNPKNHCIKDCNDITPRTPVSLPFPCHRELSEVGRHQQSHPAVFWDILTSLRNKFIMVAKKIKIISGLLLYK